jgi:hypothetical protein
VTEADLLDRVLGLCRQHDVLAFHAYDSRSTTGHGFPDLVLAGLVHTVFVELKSSTGCSTPAQTQWKWRVIASLGSGAYYKWMPRDLTDGVIESVIIGLNVRRHGE